MKPSFKETRTLLHQAVSKRIFSGASLLVFLKGKMIFREEAGFTCWPDGGLTPQPVGEETLFDLASLTKPLATGSLTLLFLQEGVLNLDDRVGTLLPAERLSQELSETSVKALLNHSSGFPDWRPYFSMMESGSPGQKALSAIESTVENRRRWIYQAIHRESFVYPPGTKNVYSDLGFILLGEILEKKSGQNLSRLFQEKMVRPLRLKDLGFIPIEKKPGQSAPLFGAGRSFAATEKSDFRHKIIQGEVHDDNAYMMGGVAGHAGLFGTSLSVYHCFSEWRNGYFNGGKLFSSSMVSPFVERDRFAGNWGLGWMFPSIPSSAGQYFSGKSFGHLGFTGTSVWFDPLADLGVIFLSNRVHPTRENNALKEFRPLLHDTVYREAFDDQT